MKSSGKWSGTGLAHGGKLAGIAAMASLLAACGTVRPGAGEPRASLPLVEGWYEGKRAYYVTTDMSDAGMAQNQGVNYVPRLANALTPEPLQPGYPSSIDRIYKFMNFNQGSVLPSAPEPMGGSNRNRAYSPLWQLVAVNWLPGKVPVELHSEEAVLEAADAGNISLTPLRIIVNCPVVKVGNETLNGVTVSLP